MRAFLLMLAAALASPAQAADTIRSMDAVSAALRGCWQAPSGPAGAYVTLSFAFRSDGALLGPPEVAAIHLPGVDRPAQEKFANDAAAALEHCVPLAFDPGFGANIAGSVFTMRFPAAQ